MLEDYTDKQLESLAEDLAKYAQGRPPLGLRMLDLPDEIFDIATKYRTTQRILDALQGVR
jgi:hypothetical protein